MIAQKTMRKVLEQLPVLYDKLGVELNHREGLISELPKTYQGLPCPGGVRVSAGERNWEGEFILDFSEEGVLTSILRETWAGQNIREENILSNF